MPESPHAETTEVSLRIGMSPDAFRKVQEEFIRDLAAVLDCDADEIKILGVYPARPDIHPDFTDAAQLQELGALGLTEY